jgi:hypothetical protein
MDVQDQKLLPVDPQQKDNGRSERTKSKTRSHLTNISRPASTSFKEDPHTPFSFSVPTPNPTI